MPLTLVLGPANSAKAGEVLGAYARRRAPRRAAGRADRAPTPSTTRASWPPQGAVLGSVLTFAGLAREIARRAGYARPAAVGAAARAGAPPGASPAARSRCSARLAPARRVRGRGRRPDRRARALAGHAAAVRRGDADVGSRGRAPRRATPEDVASLYLALRPRARARSGGSTPSCTRGARSTRCAPTPGAWGDGSRCSSTASTTSTRSSATRSRRSRRVAGAEVTVSLTYEAGRAALGARAEAVEELRPLADAGARAAGARRALRARSRGGACTTSSARCSSRAPPSGSIPGRRCGCSRPAASAPRPSSSPPRCSRCCERASRRRRSRSCTARPRPRRRLLERVFAAVRDRGRARPAGAVRPHAARARACSRWRAARCWRDRRGADDLLAYLRTPGVLERPELADGLEARAAPRGLRSAAAGARAARAGALGEIDALRGGRRPGGRARSPGPPAVRGAAPGRAPAARSAPRSSTRARWRRARRARRSSTSSASACRAPS